MNSTPISITIGFTSGSKVASRLWTGKSRTIWIMEPMQMFLKIVFIFSVIWTIWAGYVVQSRLWIIFQCWVKWPFELNVKSHPGS